LVISTIYNSIRNNLNSPKIKPVKINSIVQLKAKAENLVSNIGKLPQRTMYVKYKKNDVCEKKEAEGRNVNKFRVKVHFFLPPSD